MEVEILSLFPDYFRGPLGCSIIGKAIEKGLVKVNLVDMRDFAEDKRGTVDDRPYGGGPGMVLKPEPVIKAIRSVRRADSHVVYLSPQGKKLDAKMSESIASEHKHLILLCGHYEGIDQRIIDLEVDEEISIGDYVLTSGCPAALVLLDAAVRFIPEVIGHPRAAYEDSFHLESGFDGPQYTRPPVYEGIEVPEVLQQGHHAKIEAWRAAEGKKKWEMVGSSQDKKS